MSTFRITIQIEEMVVFRGVETVYEIHNQDVITVSEDRDSIVPLYATMLQLDKDIARHAS